MTAPERSLLFVFAHPDDESYGVAGTIARYSADRRTRVAVATMTRGEASRHLESLGITGEELGRRREAEVKAAVRVLGCDEHYQFGYPDSAMRHVDPRDVEADVRELIRKVDADVVVTFDITGISGHPDHHAVASAVTRAFVEEREREGGPARLAYYGVREEDIRNWKRFIHTMKPEHVDVCIDCRATLDLRELALQSHQSVIGDIERDGKDDGLRREEECYTLFQEPRDGRAGKTLDDLFADLPADRARSADP